MNGLLLIDKPIQYTSHDVVARMRRAINLRAIGHAGTLDPFATGLLILCVGQATRLSEYLIGETKTYTGRMKLGERTNTDDLDGEVVERKLVNVTQEDLQRVRERFIGEIMQTPPQYSAIQVGGRRAYKMARKGETVDLPARHVRISELELALDTTFVNLRVTCSAGTYIRALARDVGEALGCGAHLTALRRERSGDFTLDEAVSLDTLIQAAAEGHWQQYLLPMDRAVMHLPATHLEALQAQRFVMGQAVPAVLDGEIAREGSLQGLCRVYDAGGCFVAIGQVDAGQGLSQSLSQGLLHPFKVFHSRE